jgi:hypothetical protein
MCDSLIDYMSCDNIKQIKQFVHEVSDDGRVASTTCLLCDKNKDRTKI